MNVPLTFSSPLGNERGLRRQAAGLVAKALATVLVLACFTGTCLATDQPPETAAQQRAWLLSCLVTDMQSVGSFTSDDIARTVTLVNTLTDDQVSLLARFYYLTRAKTEQDARLYAVQLSDTEEALAQAKAQVADLLTRQQDEIEQTYSELETINPGCQTLCQVAYASVPGWCAYNRCAIPDWYYNNGCYVGPVFSAGYCGAYAVPVYGTFYDRASRYNYWNSRDYVSNNIVRIGHGYRYGPTAGGARHPYLADRNGGAVAVNRNSHATATNRAQTAVARHDTPSLHKPASVARSHSSPVVRQAKNARPASRSQSHAVAHNRPTAHVQAHATPHPQHAAGIQHVAHAQPRPQHVAQARSSSGHARRW